METTLKNTSIRCDLHPPLSAIMYCDACKSFLCRICAEVRVGGRVCASCKKPCREPSADEFTQLVAQRQKAKEDATLAKAAESRIKDQLERAKVEREARLKAEFAARKAALAQPQPAAANGAPPSFSAPQPQTFNAPAMYNAAASPTAPAAPAGETMYKPGAKLPQTERDPLMKLGEHAHINVIGKAKTYMMIIGILTSLVAGIWLAVVFAADNAIESHEWTPAEEARQIADQAPVLRRSMEQQRAHEEQLAREHEEFEASKAVLHAAAVIVKLILTAYLMVGVTMIVLFFLCETYPRGATMAAFIIYLAINLIDLLTVRSGGLIAILFRIAALTALYNGMVAGNTLHKMRLEEAAAA